jgi:hypothetical protein
MYTQKFIITLLFVTTLFQGFSQSKNFIDQPYLETSVKTDTLVSPNQIYLSILISEKDTRGKISVEKLENKMAVELKSLGIDLNKQLSLLDLSSNFKKYFLKADNIQKTKSYSLLVYDGYTAGKVIQAMERINISNISIEKLTHSGIENLKLALKKKAVLKAKQNATVMIEPLGQKVGKALYIADISGYSNYRFQDESKQIRIRGASIDNTEPLTVSFEKIKVESSITVRFSIE